MIEVGDNKYEIVENVNNCFDEEIFKELYTDYFGPFDYIFGDFSYGKVRLKGFNDSNSRRVKSINDIKRIDDYKKDFCSVGADTYLLKKIKDEKE